MSERQAQANQAIKKMNAIVKSVRKERDTKGMRENLGYGKEANRMRDFLESVKCDLLTYQDKYQVMTDYTRLIDSVNEGR